MGKDNRSRRAAKAKSRLKGGNRTMFGGGREERANDRKFGQQFEPEPPPTAPWRPFDPPPAGDFDPPLRDHEELAAGIIGHLLQGRMPEYVEHQALSSLAGLQVDVVDRLLESRLAEQVASLWGKGWQPAELVRQGRLGCSNGAGARLVELAVAADHANRRADTLDRRWMEQVDELDLPETNGKSGWVHRWQQAEQLDRVAAASSAVGALVNIWRLQDLDELLPPPGSAKGPSATATASIFSSAGNDPVLKRIRGLLAKAESSEFEAEAEAFTAKAQELMTRHAIDNALLGNESGGPASSPDTIRVPIDAPYVGPKSLLLQNVAEASRCRAVMHGGLALSSVVGFAADLVAVELLFTSLLVQAQAALNEAAKHAPPGTRVRSQRYRSTFLASYATRIGQRLTEINEAVFKEVAAKQGSAFLPVLASREVDIDDAISEKFGKLKTSRVGGSHDAAGWHSGQAAANRAKLNAGSIASRTGL